MGESGNYRELRTAPELGSEYKCTHLPVPARTTVCSLQHLGCTILHKRSRGCVEPATYRVHTSLPGLVVTLAQTEACHCLASSTGCYLRSSLVPLLFPQPRWRRVQFCRRALGVRLPPGASASLLQLPKAPMAGRRPKQSLGLSVISTTSCRAGDPAPHVRRRDRMWGEGRARRTGLPKEGCRGSCPSAFPP